MLRVHESKSFKKSLRRIKRQGKNLRRLAAVLTLLETRQSLPAQLKDHQLTGNLRTCRECHLEPDWLLIYRFQKDPHGNDVLELISTGSHSELFGK